MLKNRAILGLMLVALSACVLQSDPGKEGPQGPQGATGSQGPPGVSPFTYTDASMTDISYSGGRVGIGTATPEAELQVLGGVVIGPGNTDAIIKLNADSSGRGSLIRTNAGASGNYNGLWMASNTQTDSSQSNEILPSWAIDLGGFDNIGYPGSGDTFSILRRPPGGSFLRMMALDGAGNVGIGTTAPAGLIHAYRPGDHSRIRVETDGVGNSSALLELKTDQRTWTILNRRSLGSIFQIRDESSNVDALTILADGNVGIGTTNPQYMLDVEGDMRLSNGLIRSPDGNVALNLQNGANYTYGDFSVCLAGAGCAPSGTTHFFVRSGDGFVGIGTTNPQSMLHVAGNIQANSTVYSSDARLKVDIEPLGPSLEQLLKLHGVTYKWKEPEKHGNRTGVQIGMIAQEVEKVFPDWVVVGTDGYKAVGYPGFEALTVEGFREIKDENEWLKKKVASLEERLSAVEKKGASQHASAAIDGRWPFAILFGSALTAAPFWLRRRRSGSRSRS